jgi:GST-like protein
VRRGRLVNSAKGLTERHDASDFAALDPELLGGIVKGY